MVCVVSSALVARVTAVERRKKIGTFIINLQLFKAF